MEPKFTAMKIQVENFIIETSQYGGYNLVEEKKGKQKNGKEVVRSSVVMFSVDLDIAIKRIIHLNLHYNPNIVSLRQYLVDYRNEVKKIEKLVELEKLKNKY